MTDFESAPMTQWLEAAKAHAAGQTYTGPTIGWSGGSDAHSGYATQNMSMPGNGWTGATSQFDKTQAISPSILAALRGLDPNQQKASGNGGMEWFDPATGMSFQPDGAGGWMAYDGARGRAEGDNYVMSGQQYHKYDGQGNYIGDSNFGNLHKNGIMDQLLPLGMMSLPFLLPALGVGGAGAAGASGGGAVGSGAGFVGEGALSGIGAWDGALAGAGGLGGAGAGLGGAGAALGAGGGAAGGASGLGGLLKSGVGSLLGGGGGGSSLLGLGATALGALAGGQGNNASASSTRAMDPRMDSLFYGDLAPRTQGLLSSQMGQAQGAGNQMLGMGSNLLGQTAPTTATNPYLKSIADDMQRRTQEMLGQNNLAIQGNAVGVGGLGGSRQGVAQGLAAGQAADSLQGNVAGLYGNAYNQDQNRLRQDWTLGAGLMGQGLNTPWAPIQNTSNTYAPFTGFGTTTNNQQSGGGAMGALGGALGAAQFGKNMGWFGDSTGNSWGLW